MKDKYESLLLKKMGVVGCATGYKIKDSQRTDKPSVVCYVIQKKAIKDLQKEDMIPKELEGVPTDVVKSDAIQAL